MNDVERRRLRARRLALAAIITILASGAGRSPNHSGTAQAATSCTLDRATGTTIENKPFLTNGFGVRWNAATERLVYMQPGAGGYYRIFTMRPDGTDRRSLTEGRAGLPTKHQGTPYWHPSGRYVMFAAQKQDWSGRALFGIPDYEALPGFGRHDDIWLIAADGKRHWRLTDDANTADEGILLPVFSPDGKRVAWSARQEGGTYILKVADFVEHPAPHVANITSYRPGGVAYYETGSFTSDDKSLTYTSDQDTHNFWRSQIYRLDLASGKSTRLTPGNDYNEHPTVVKTRSGDRIIYMSTKGVDRYPGHLLLGTDWYVMRMDGNDAKRLTTMNVDRKDNRENAGVMQVAGAVAVSPRGDFMLGDVQDSLVKQTGLVRVVHFSCDRVTTSPSP